MTTTPASFSEEECFNVYWKIKNFSYCCASNKSPEFRFSYEQYVLELSSNSAYIECYLRHSDWRSFNLTREISFLTYDGSPVESVSGDTGVKLRVLKNVIFGNGRKSFLPENTLTVRFRSPTKSERGKLFISSQIGVKRSCVLWTLKDISKGPCQETKSVEKSERFGNVALTIKSKPGIDSAEQFCIEVSQTGCGGWCCCFLKVSILDVDGRALNEVSDEFIFESCGGRQTWGFPSIIDKRKWLRYKNQLLSEDALSLKCYFAISSGKVTDETTVISYCENVASLLKEPEDFSLTYKETSDSRSVTELQTDLKSILDDGTLSDAVLQIGSEIIQAHKNILSARSPVFRAMFAKDMKETISGTVVIEDVDVETVRKLLLYMYTDSIYDDQWENVKKLYFAADKYEVLGLRRKCSSFFKTNLSVPNVCEALVLADMHHDGDLKTAAFDFISEHDSAVLALETWKELEKNNSSLALQVMCDIWGKKRICLNRLISEFF
ncbi:Speckle-type POZ protein [Araneus ventricosus]|uniref:Speckle-type POZ protein n=1 Tax=Araneus ventricosus TaxID=182803 RepID=A0A4Y2JEF3_ARAVE|nr:Speckle-type POZ protein [Araneus ventricosus]